MDAVFVHCHEIHRGFRRGWIADRIDPEKQLTPVLQTYYDDTVLPLLDNFDISEILNNLLTKLQGLEGELEDELGRVDDAYRGLLGSIPSMGGSASAGVSI